MLDTGIIVGYVRGAPYAEFVDREYAPLEGDSIAVVSVVSHGEIYSLAYQFGWGRRKRRRLDDILRRIPRQSISHDAIIDRYAEIDAFSQGELERNPLPEGMSARNMGKNDLWISATTSVLDATLLTTDRDFDHLADEFVDLAFVDPAGDY